MAVMSIPRDLKVHVPGHGTRKINEAYHLGGPKLVDRDRQRAAGIDINHVVNVNFGGFRRAIDRLGCVYIDVDGATSTTTTAPARTTRRSTSSPATRSSAAGRAGLVRFRHDDSDFVRASRQQAFLRGEGAGRPRQALQAIARSCCGSSAATRRPTSPTEHRGDPRPHQARLRVVEVAGHRDRVPRDRLQGRDLRGDQPEELARPSSVHRRPRRPDGRPDGSQEAQAHPARDTARARPRLRAGRRARTTRSRCRCASTRSACRSTTRRPASSTGQPATRRAPAPARTRSSTATSKRYRAYRLVLYAGQLGQYYGVQGTTWKAPADPRQPDRRADHRRPQVPPLLRRQEDQAHRLGDAEGRLLGLELAVAEAHEPPDDGDRPLPSTHLTRPAGRRPMIGTKRPTRAA